MTSALTLQTLAESVRKLFVQDKREDGTAFWKCTDSNLEWVRDLCLQAHGDMMPDDWRYAFIVDALDALAENEDPDDILIEADVCTHELTAWLHSRTDRYAYVDSAMEEQGATYKTLIDCLQMGQYDEKREVLDSVLSSLESHLEEMEDDSDDSADDEPSEPEEGDWVTSDFTTFREHEGRGVIVVTASQNMKDVIKARMESDGFFPNIWYVNDHGNVSLVDIDECD